MPEFSCTFPFRVPEGTKLKALQIESAVLRPVRARIQDERFAGLSCGLNELALRIRRDPADTPLEANVVLSRAYGLTDKGRVRPTNEDSLRDSWRSSGSA